MKKALLIVLIGVLAYATSAQQTIRKSISTKVPNQEVLGEAPGGNSTILGEESRNEPITTTAGGNRSKSRFDASNPPWNIRVIILMASITG